MSTIESENVYGRKMNFKKSIEKYFNITVNFL